MLSQVGWRASAASLMQRVDLPDFGSRVPLGGRGVYASLGKFGQFKCGFIQARVARFGDVLLYRI